MSAQPAAVENGGAASTRRTNVLDLQPPTDRTAQLRRVPRLLTDALALVWEASRGHLLATVVLQTGAAVAVGGQLLISREVLQGLVAVSHGAPVSRLYPWFAALAGLGALMNAMSAVVAHEQRLLSELTAKHAFDRIMSVAAAVDYASFDEPSFHDQLERARNSGLYRSLDVVNSLLALTTGLLMSLGIAFVLVLLQPLLLAFVALAAAVPLVVSVHNGRKSFAFEYALTPESRERLYLLELMTERGPAKEIRAFGAIPFLRGRYTELSDERVRQLHAFLRGRLRVSLAGSFASLLGAGVGVGALLFMLSRGTLPVATALTAGLAMQQLASRLGTLSASVGKLIESGMFVDDYRRFLDLAPAESATPTRRTPRAPVSSLRVENVSFAYPGGSSLALDGVSLDVDAGEVVALVGENGSGKTTLVKLISGLYAPSAGRILWNGRDAAQLAPEDVQDELTILFQDYIQYHLGARENIALGRWESAHDHELVRAAARRAGAHEFVSALPDGYETRLGKQFYGGQELSVGQWQRLALARAFFRGGSFIILDEPTASLDPRAEAELFEKMRELAHGRSVLLVSHRFSSVRSADRIHVLDRGRVAESGSHDELLRLGGRYAELFELQASAYLAGSHAAG